MDSMPSRRIHLLRDTVARKIAAGEVIDRPASLLRELVDNSLDAGSRSIDIRIQKGGLQGITVRDDGGGMSKEDLEICWLPHATSKIETEEDLSRITSLGFRGEALAAVAACTRLTVTTSQDDSGGGWELRITSGAEPVVTRTSGPRGTLVQAEDLFYSIPARKQFLKSPATEAGMCRRIFEEKAQAHPGVEFRFWSDGDLKVHLRPQSLAERVCAVQNLVPALLRESSGDFSGFRLHVLAGLADLARQDRKEIHIFVNRRKIQEYSLVQAVISAYDEVLAGGLFPSAWVFLEVDPDLVDFNIHPAKREARFRNLPQIFQALASHLRQTLHDLRLRMDTPIEHPELPVFSEEPGPRTIEDRNSGSYRGFAGTELGGTVGEGTFFQAYQAALDRNPPPATPAEARSRFRYLGQVLRLFLVVERDDTLYLLDQHAAHERILFEELRVRKSERQKLLVPREIPCEAAEALVLRDRLAGLKDLGVVVEEGEGTFHLLEIPQVAAPLEAEVALFLQKMTGTDFDLEKELYARLACRAAVMDGHVLDDLTAVNLIEKAFGLENARCPHGRPVWRSFSREELYRMFERIV